MKYLKIGINSSGASWLYGYSKDWLTTGKEPKLVTGQGRKLSALQKRIIMDVEQMNEDELHALFAFIESLKKIMKSPPSRTKTQFR